MGIPTNRVQVCEFLLCVGAAYLFWRGFLVALYSFSSWAVKKLEGPTEKINTRRKVFWAVVVTALLPVLYFSCHYLLNPLKFAGVAAFLCTCWLGVRICYVDIRLWLMKRKKRATKI